MTKPEKKLRLLLLPYGSTVGKDASLHEGFDALLSRKKISDFKCIYYFALAREKGAEETKKEILKVAHEYQPHVILLSHVGHFPISHSFIHELKSVNSKPTFVYDEGDIYGGFHKPLPSATKIALSHADLVSLRGLGSVAKKMHRGFPEKIIYTPHLYNTKTVPCGWKPSRERKYDVIFIGNRIGRYIPILHRVPWARFPGAFGREKLVRRLGQIFGDRFAVFGRGWDGYIGYQGVIDFNEQATVNRESWITVGYDHYPMVPFYHSDRLAIALASGVAHLCHYHPGYEFMFKNMGDLAWFQTVDEAVDIIRFMLSRGPDWLIEMGQRGQEYANMWLSAERVWESFLLRVLEHRNLNVNI